MRWLLLDEVTCIEKGKVAKARSRVPSEDVSPELLMVEMMAQTGGLLLGAETDFQGDVVFTKVEAAEFSASFEPGDPLEIEATSESLKPEGAWLDGRISRAGEPLASAKILLMNVGRLSPDHAKSLTFHDAFMKHFKVKEKLVTP